MGCFRNVGLFLCSSLLAGQGFRATIVGRVTDESGAVVPGTRITITNTGTNESRAVTVGADGEYSIPQLAPGEYSLGAEHAGFNRFVQSGIVLETNQQALCVFVIELFENVPGKEDAVNHPESLPVVTASGVEVFVVRFQEPVIHPICCAAG